MRIGVDFPGMFGRDNFTTRRTTGHNWYDPECLITGAEIAQGFTARNSTRDYLSEAHYHACVAQELTPEVIARTAPRVYRPEFEVHEYPCNAVQRLWESSARTKATIAETARPLALGFSLF